VRTHLPLHCIDNQLHQQVSLKHPPVRFENPSLADLRDEHSDVSRANMPVIRVEFSPRLRRKKSIRQSNLCQLIDEGE
jgi:hypothetical protein